MMKKRFPVVRGPTLILASECVISESHRGFDRRRPHRAARREEFASLRANFPQGYNRRALLIFSLERITLFRAREDYISAYVSAVPRRDCDYEIS
jgi:hypothetical protein